jgi:hypothetical protein
MMERRRLRCTKIVDKDTIGRMIRGSPLHPSHIDSNMLPCKSVQGITKDLEKLALTVSVFTSAGKQHGALKKNATRLWKTH